MSTVTAKFQQWRAPRARSTARPAAAPTTPTTPTDNKTTGLWTRIKTTATRIVRTVKTGAVKTATRVAVTFTTATQAVRRLVRRRPRFTAFAKRIKKFAARCWVRALRPLLRATLQVMALTTVLLGMLFQPLLTMIGLTVLGCVAYGLALLLEWLMQGSARRVRLAAWLIRGLELCVKLGTWVAYGVSALALLAVCATSVAAALACLLYLGLAYYEVPSAATYAWTAFLVFNGAWFLAVLYFIWDMSLSETPTWQRRVAVTPAAAPVAPTAAMDVTDMAECTVCDTVSAHLVPSRVCHEPNARVCAACAAAEAAFASTTDVPPVTRNPVVHLTADAIAASAAYQQSRNDLAHWYWLETAHYQEPDGRLVPREWSVLGNGVVQATVRYHYKRNVVQGFDAAKRLIGTVPVLKGNNAVVSAVQCAQQHVTDELDRRDSLRQQATMPMARRRAPQPRQYNTGRG